MQCNLEKAIINQAVTNLILRYHKELYDELVHKEEDKDIFNDTYLKLTYKYNPDKDFKEQFKWFFNQLKGAYYRDSRANIHYRINEEVLCIPDFIKDEEAIASKDDDLITKLRAICQL